ncbi:short-chain oxidoreductase [Moniliophthora roreri]|nr:short-chain oxidoreductase [Moniliophthora roreri]
MLDKARELAYCPDSSLVHTQFYQSFPETEAQHDPEPLLTRATPRRSFVTSDVLGLKNNVFESCSERQLDHEYWTRSEFLFAALTGRTSLEGTVNRGDDIIPDYRDSDTATRSVTRAIIKTK